MDQVLGQAPGERADVALLQVRLDDHVGGEAELARDDGRRPLRPPEVGGHDAGEAEAAEVGRRVHRLLLPEVGQGASAQPCQRRSAFQVVWP